MDTLRQEIKQRIQASIDVKRKLLESTTIIETLEKVMDVMVEALRRDKKILLCGNGGSAADAQHIAAELSGRFYSDRDPLFAEALHVNTSYLTAVANDYSYDEIYSRLVKAKGRKGDVLVGLSTSGNSKNVIKALQVAQSQGMVTVGLSGDSGGRMKNRCHYLINIPSDDTPRIQEAHILVGHIICEFIELRLFDGRS